MGRDTTEGARDMNLKQLEYFVAIAEEQQITAAARRLHISQPPLSYELATLERELGCTLVKRGPRRATLTSAGALLYERALSVLALVRATEREVSAFGKGLAGTLSIGMISSCGGMVPTDEMQAFRDDYPDVSFEVHEGNTFQVLEMLERGIIDVGVVRTPFKADGLACYGEDEAGFPELLKAWHEGKPVDLSLFSRGNTETPYYKGPFVISSLEQTAPAGEDTTFSATFDNAGAPVTFDEKKFDATTAGGA